MNVKNVQYKSEEGWEWDMKDNIAIVLKATLAMIRQDYEQQINNSG